MLKIGTYFVLDVRSRKLDCFCQCFATNNIDVMLHNRKTQIRNFELIEALVLESLPSGGKSKRSSRLIPVTSSAIYLRRTIFLVSLNAPAVAR